MIVVIVTVVAGKECKIGCRLQPCTQVWHEIIGLEHHWWNLACVVFVWDCSSSLLHPVSGGTSAGITPPATDRRRSTRIDTLAILYSSLSIMLRTVTDIKLLCSSHVPRSS